MTEVDICNGVGRRVVVWALDRRFATELKNSPIEQLPRSIHGANLIARRTRTGWCLVVSWLVLLNQYHHTNLLVSLSYVADFRLMTAILASTLASRSCAPGKLSHLRPWRRLRVFRYVNPLCQADRLSTLILPTCRPSDNPSQVGLQ